MYLETLKRLSSYTLDLGERSVHFQDLSITVLAPRTLVVSVAQMFYNFYNKSSLKVFGKSR